MANMTTISTKTLLLYLARMGSFTTAQRVPNEDNADQDLSVPKSATWDQMLKRCQRELEDLPPKVGRSFLMCPLISGRESVCSETTINDDEQESDLDAVRVMQWNILSQALSETNDNFVACPDEALSWNTRRWRLLEEIISTKPDVLCLQEVDHFQFLKKTLGALGFRGIFCPKPDSPCLYVEGNNGPDGCSIFWNDREFELVESHSRVLEVWGCTSNQVALMVVLRRRRRKENEDKPCELSVVTTHLKARQGTLLSALRLEQGKDLLRWVHQVQRPGCPLIVAGDFNAEPNEPVYKAVLTDSSLQLDSSYAVTTTDYADLRNGNLVEDREPPYTTWKIREEGEVCHTIDYIFYSRQHLEPKRILGLPSEEQIGPLRVPSFGYPSDHFSMATDFRFLNCAPDIEDLKLVV